VTTAAANGWSSLEVAKLAAAIATPIAVVLLGLYVKKAGRQIEDAQWSTRKLVERRLELYQEMAPHLNDLYCFFTCRGDFRSITPPDAIDLKRRLDKNFHVNQFLFEPDFKERYDEFMKLCFLTYEGSGTSARPRSTARVQERERGPGHWKPEWSSMLLAEGEAGPSFQDVHREYEDLMVAFASEVGVGEPGAANRGAKTRRT
jgi:hypothetical protein